MVTLVIRAKVAIRVAFGSSGYWREIPVLVALSTPLIIEAALFVVMTVSKELVQQT